jgi:hypothetical protein
MRQTAQGCAQPAQKNRALPYSVFGEIGVRIIVGVATVILLFGPVPRPIAAPALQGSDGVSPVDFIQMISSGVGWAKTAICDPCPAKVTSGLMLRTTDSGTRWQDITPLDSSGEKIVVAGFYTFIFNSQIAWVGGPPRHRDAGTCSPCTFRTIDGGRTWKKTSYAPGSLINPRDGWTISILYYEPPQGYPAEIYRTTDGGETWIKVASTEDRRSGLPGGGSKKITFLNSTTGWITRTYNGNFKPSLFVTKDGGRTWREQELPTPSNAPRVVENASGERYVDGGHFQPSPPKFFTAQDGIVRFDYDLDGRAFIVFYTTHNGGETWTPTSPIPVTETPSGPYTVPSSDFVSRNRGWLKQADTLRMTNNGGRDWTTIRVDPLLAGVTQLNFISPEVGWAVRQSPPFLLRTENGGRAWTPLPYTITGQ